MRFGLELRLPTRVFWGIREARDLEAPLCSLGAIRDVVSGTSREHLGNACGTFGNTNVDTKMWLELFQHDAHGAQRLVSQTCG